MNDSPGRRRVPHAEADAVAEADTMETAAAGAPRTFLPNARRIHTHQHHTHRPTLLAASRTPGPAPPQKTTRSKPLRPLHAPFSPTPATPTPTPTTLTAPPPSPRE
ncbi:hypothetical protein AB0945_02735 [Streptomyces sp. NPDC005474]|uniref:hypothetical protein n=1 Tax=Streptomyces sp. NPDC005474 TaxID=3154878 RepID=UPI00345399E9